MFPSQALLYVVELLLLLVAGSIVKIFNIYVGGAHTQLPLLMLSHYRLPSFLKTCKLKSLFLMFAQFSLFLSCMCRYEHLSQTHKWFLSLYFSIIIILVDDFVGSRVFDCEKYEFSFSYSTTRHSALSRVYFLVECLSFSRLLLRSTPRLEILLFIPDT